MPFLSKALCDEVLMAVLMWCVECRIVEDTSTASPGSTWREALLSDNEDMDDDDDDDVSVTSDDHNAAD